MATSRCGLARACGPRPSAAGAGSSVSMVRTALTGYIRTSGRRRANQSRAMIASTNGVNVRYSARSISNGPDLEARAQARLHDADHETSGERDPQ